MVERLVHALQTLAAPAEDQLTRVPDFVRKANNLALDFADALRLVSDCPQILLEAEQQYALDRLDGYLEARSTPAHMGFWTEAAIRESAEWDTVRRLARDALASLRAPQELSPPSGRVTMMESVLIGAADPDIVACEAQLRAAQLTADIAALERLIADELLFTGPDGQLATKAQDLEAHRSGIVRFREHVPEELRIRRVGRDVAVAALRARLAVAVAGTLVRGTYRYTRVWARDGNASWRVVGGHVSTVPPAAGESGPAE